MLFSTSRLGGSCRARYPLAARKGGNKQTRGLTSMSSDNLIIYMGTIIPTSLSVLYLSFILENGVIPSGTSV